MLEKIKALIRDNDMCVLATMSLNGPHASLMAYTCSSDCAEIYLATPRQTQKYRNLSTDNQVSLLVDTRMTAGRQNIQAVTITGRAQEISDAAHEVQIRNDFLHRHVHLQGFLDLPDIAFILVRVDSFQLLSGAQDSYYIRLTESNTY